jgi:hypothetical protein
LLLRVHGMCIGARQRAESTQQGAREP